MSYVLTSMLMLLPQAGSPDGQWVEEFVDGPFTFRSEFPIRRTSLLRDLAQLREELSQTLGLKIGDRPIQVYFFRDRASYLQYMKANVPEGLRRRALFVRRSSGSSVYAYRTRDFDTDVRHECTHALVHNAVPFIPLWMDEGLAEYFESKAGMRPRPPRLNDVRSAVRWQRLTRRHYSLQKLERIETIQDMGATEYQDSWAWIHFLLHDSAETRKVLVEYLAEIQRGTPPGPFSVYCARSLPDYTARLTRHFRTFQ